eukprot:symbB.v1.2.016049.t1/scaffold1213.1/size131181/2
MPSHFSRTLPSSIQDEGLQHTTSMGLDSLSLGAGSRNYGIPGMGPDAPGGAMGSRAYGIPGLGLDVSGVGSMKPFEVDTGGATGSRAFSTPGVALDAPGASRYGMSGMALEGPGVAGSRAFSTPVGFLDTPGAGGCRNSRAFGGPGSIPGIPGIMADPAGVAGSHLSSSPGMAFDAPGVIGSRAFPMPGMAPERPDPGSGFTIPKIDFADPGRWNLPMTNVAAGLDLGLDRPNLPELVVVPLHNKKWLAVAPRSHGTNRGRGEQKRGKRGPCVPPLWTAECWKPGLAGSHRWPDHWHHFVGGACT